MLDELDRLKNERVEAEGLNLTSSLRKQRKPLESMTFL